MNNVMEQMKKHSKIMKMILWVLGIGCVLEAISCLMTRDWHGMIAYTVATLAYIIALQQHRCIDNQQYIIALLNAENLDYVRRFRTEVKP